MALKEGQREGGTQRGTERGRRGEGGGRRERWEKEGEEID